MNPHFEAVPSLGTLTTRGLAGGDLQHLGGESDGALDAEVLGPGAFNQVGGNLLQSLHLPAYFTPGISLALPSTPIGTTKVGTHW